MMGYSIAAALAGALAGFFAGTAWQLHPLNREVKGWGYLLAALCTILCGAALVGVARG